MMTTELQRSSVVVYLAVLLLFLGVTPPVRAACGKNGGVFRFKPANTPGVSSFLKQPGSVDNVTGTPILFVEGVALPTIVVEARMTDIITGEQVPDRSMDGLTVFVRTEPLLQLLRFAVDFAEGQAVFDQLTVARGVTQIGESYAIYFEVPEVPNYVLPGGILQRVNPSSIVDSLIFDDYGFFTSNESLRVPVESNIPHFALRALTTTGAPIKESTAVFNLDIEVLPAGSGTVTPSRLDFVGAAGFSNLQLEGVPLTTTTIQLRFTVSSKAAGGGSATLLSPPMEPIHPWLPKQFMLFSPQRSIIPYNGSKVTAVMGQRLPPIVIQLLDSRMNRETVTGLVVTVTCEQAPISGGNALMQAGEATFDALTFPSTAPRSAVLTFTAGPEGNLPVAGQRLYGIVEVSESAQRAKHISFAPESYAQANQVMVVEARSSKWSIPKIVVQVQDSAYQLDSTAQGIDLLVQGELLGNSKPADSGQQATVQNGMAVFNNVEFTKGTENKIDFVRVVALANDNMQLQTGEVLIRANADVDLQLQTCRTSSIPDCPLKIKFDTPERSYLSEPGQELFANVGTVIPDIRIQMANEFGLSPRFQADPPVIVAFTGSDHQNEVLLEQSNRANEGQFISARGVFFFGCLVFRSKPAGLVRLTFRVINGTTRQKLDGFPDLVSGFVSTTITPTPAYDLRFSSGGSLITYRGQLSSAVVNVAMPPIVVELVNSEHAADLSVSGIVIVASLTSGELDVEGSQAKMLNGRATFSTLKFKSLGNEPRLVFTAQTTPHPVSGKSVSTGALTVTMEPIASYEIAFAGELDDDNAVSYPNERFELKDDGTMPVGVVVRNSAHEVETVSSGSTTMTLAVISEDADLTMPTGSTRVLPDNGEMRANFRFGIQTTARFLATPRAFVTFTVTASAIPILVGKSLTIGPVTKRGITTDTCDGKLLQPTSVVQFGIGLGEYEAEEEDIRTRIAYQMNVEPDRVILSDPKSTKGIEYATQSEWTGTRVSVKFGPAPAGSKNMKSSAVIASEFLRLESPCDADGLCIRSIFPETVSTECDKPALDAAVADAQACTNIYSECDCYAELLFSTDNGENCATDPAYQNFFADLCTSKFEECRLTSVVKVCEDLIESTFAQLLWLWITLGVLGFIILVLIVLWQRGFFTKKVVSLHTSMNRK